MHLNYPENLPVSAHRGEILAAMRRSDVVIVCGDTGSGKTTQLPKMALELGRGAHGRRIAVTQPRRLAAVAMAERVAEELGEPVGGLVGYQHRFGRQVSRDTRVKFMTDGVLLAETRSDPLLGAYDTILVDEAHERSLNVDFLLGILKRILERRRDLKVIVASATMDTERFSAFFGGVPVVNVPGRLYPVEIRYVPPPESDERDLARDVADAVEILPPRDDILVFLPGERDIRETAEELVGRYGEAANDVIPLLASLPAAQQQRAFRLSSRRRIVLATNVAETSVTIPGIRAVIDSGLARISRYIHRTHVQRLQIEPISQASARQRAGRCGRLGPGTCIRLYSEEDFNSRDDYTAPEVLRSSLAGVILTMLDLRLGDIAAFPFIDAPKSAMIHEGFRELIELGAIERQRIVDSGQRIVDSGQRIVDRGQVGLTEIGRMLARIPVEPRLARMLVAASENAALPSVLPIVAALSCDDPKRRPIDEREKADQAHAPFRVPGSDFLGILKLWNWWDETTRDLSQSKQRALAKKTYLSYPKMREWRDLVRQLTDLSKRIGLSFAVCEPRTRNLEPRTSNLEPRTCDDEFSVRLHYSLLSGLLGHVGRYDEEERDYRGAHGLRFALHPSSVLTKKVKVKGEGEQRNLSLSRTSNLESRTSRSASPAWIMAGELVDTSRLFARPAAEIDPAWLEPIAGELCRHSYREPSWDAKSGFVRCLEQVTLYGLVIVGSRRRDLSHIDPPLAHEIFIRDGLVGCAFPNPPPAVRECLALITTLRRRAETTRRPELFNADLLAAHFVASLPDDVSSADALRRWLRRARPEEIERFKLKKSDWWTQEDVDDRDFPSKIRIGGITLALEYRHTPDDSETDGITCTVRKADIGALRLWQPEWLVPGALPEKLNWMLSTLPNSLQRVLVPRDEKIAVLLSKLKPGAESLPDAFRRVVYEEWGFKIAPDAWSGLTEPTHFKVRFRVLDDHGKVLLTTRSQEEVLELGRKTLDVRRKSDQPPTNYQLSTTNSRLSTTNSQHPTPATTWSFGSIPERTSGDHAGWDIVHYPALLDETTGVTLRLYRDTATARRIHDGGVTRLLRFALASDLRLRLRTRDLPIDAALHLKSVGYELEDFADDIFAGAIRAALVEGRPAVRTEADFVNRAGERKKVLEAQFILKDLCVAAIAEAERLQNAAEGDSRISPATVDAVTTQLAWLVVRGFPARTPLAQLKHFARYLKGVALRIERARNGGSSDKAKEARVAPHWQRYVEAATGRDRTPRDPVKLAAYRWLVEEYRVSVFAQELKTAVPVSPRRLDALWNETTAKPASDASLIRRI